MKTKQALLAPTMHTITMRAPHKRRQPVTAHSVRDAFIALNDAAYAAADAARRSDDPRIKEHAAVAKKLALAVDQLVDDVLGLLPEDAA